MLRFLTLTIFALAAAFVAAQNPCVTKCHETSAVNVLCSSPNDLTCVCKYIVPFMKSVRECIQANCPDQSTTQQTSEEIFCASLSNGLSSGVSDPSTSAPGTSASGTSASGTSASGTSRPSTSIPASGTASTTRSSATGAAFKNTPVAGAMGALTALVGAAIF